jgi:hypothetical protein
MDMFVVLVVYSRARARVLFPFPSFLPSPPLPFAGFCRGTSKWQCCMARGPAEKALQAAFAGLR